MHDPNQPRPPENKGMCFKLHDVRVSLYKIERQMMKILMDCNKVHCIDDTIECQNYSN